MKDKTPSKPDPDEPPPGEELIDPQDSDKESDQLKGQTKLHAKPARLEDEGQSGG